MGDETHAIFLESVRLKSGRKKSECMKTLERTNADDGSYF